MTLLPQDTDPTAQIGRLTFCKKSVACDTNGSGEREVAVPPVRERVSCALLKQAVRAPTQRQAMERASWRGGGPHV